MAADRIFGLFMMILALGYILSASNIQTSFMSDPVGPRLFPYLVAGVVIICSLSLVLKPDQNADWPRGQMLMKLAMATVLLLAYGMAIRPLGFILPTIVVSGILSYMIHPRAMTAALSGVGLGVGLYVLFKVILGLGLQGLPRALLG